MISIIKDRLTPWLEQNFVNTENEYLSDGKMTSVWTKEYDGETTVIEFTPSHRVDFTRRKVVELGCSGLFVVEVKASSSVMALMMEGPDTIMAALDDGVRRMNEKIDAAYASGALSRDGIDRDEERRSIQAWIDQLREIEGNFS